jgi:hypothetical protein
MGDPCALRRVEPFAPQRTPIMRLELSTESRVLVDLRAAGLLRAVGHSPTLTVHANRWTIDTGGGAAIDAAINMRFAANSVEPPDDIPASDREKMRHNMCGRDVLDVARFPTIELHGHYAGTLDGGILSGDLHVRGAPRHISMTIRLSRSDAVIAARGVCERRLTDLGIKPFKALLGTLKLEDWIRLRLEASLLVR